MGKLLSLVLFLILLGTIFYFATSPKELNKITDKFIDTSNKAVTLATYWANGGQIATPSATSGAESINFEEVIPENVTPPENVSKRDVLKECEDNFIYCIEKSHEKYGIYVSVTEVYFATDSGYSEQFYLTHRSPYQPQIVWTNITTETFFPLYLVGAEAQGLGQFVAICKDGSYPEDLNVGLPC